MGALSLDEMEVVLRFDRASDEAVLQVPAAGFASWRRALERAGIVPQEQRLGGEIIGYLYRFPKVWARAPLPKRTRKPKVVA